MPAVITDENSGYTPDLQPLWHHKAPRHLVETCPAEDFVRGWKTWQKHLRKRKKPIVLPFLAKKKSPLLWGWPQDWDRAAVAESIQSPTTLAEIFIGDDPTASLDLSLALQTVALAYAMPRLARDLPAESWWQLLDRLRDVASEAQNERVHWPTDPQSVVRQQLLAGELPFALSYLFPEVRALRDLRALASESLSEALCAVTDGQGLPDARLLPVLGPLFACWTRATWLGSQIKRGVWSREAALQYQWLLRHSIRLADKDGRFVLTPFLANGAATKKIEYFAWDKRMFATAIRMAGDPGDRAAADFALPRGVLCKRFKPKADDLPRPTLNSDWAGITIMADGWAQSDTRLAASYIADQLNIEFSVCGEKLFAGLWNFETHCDGRLAKPIGDWEQLCWERGKLHNLLELGRPLSEGMRLERQILFGVEDHVIYLADSITSADGSAHKIRHSLDLPLAASINWKPEAETRDGVLIGRKIRAAIIPAALQEWRADPRGGSLELWGGRLALTQETHGRALSCPLIIDLDPRRTKNERTWRQLTVAENLEIVPSDIAVSYRAQSGDGQWLFYRSLGPVGNRTFLGQNISGEFTAGRFPSTGKFNQWIEIEEV